MKQKEFDDETRSASAIEFQKQGKTFTQFVRNEVDNSSRK